ncbi:MAG: alpha/beta fold hydrolase [Bacteroidota bacterium]
MLNYKIYGEGHPVVFLHGFLESLTMWETFDLGGCSFQSVLIDLPGHGNLPLNKEYKNLAEVAAEIKAFLEGLGIGQFDLIGHSLGGYIAVELHKITDQNGKLMLYHSNFWGDDEQKKKDRNRVIDVVRKNKTLFLNEAIPNLFLPAFRKEAFVAELREEAGKIDPETIILYSGLMRDRGSNASYVKDLKNKVLFVQGEQDHIVPKQAIESRPDVVPVICTGAGHMGHFEEKEHEFEIIRTFFGN